MRVVTLYRLDTGALGGVVSGSDADIARNTPDGFASIDGEHDRMSWRVDPASGQLVDWIPPAPPDTATETYSWNAETRRWQPTLTLEGRRVPLRAIVQRRIAEAESLQHRAVREWILAADTAARQRAEQLTRQVEARILALRGKLAQIDSGQLPTTEELESA